MSKPTITEYQYALSTLCKSLKTDPELWEAFKANIAMAFKDEYDKVEVAKKRPPSREEIHDIANTAADNFLKLLVQPFKKKIIKKRKPQTKR